MKVKICGITDVQTALAAKACGADFAGLIFAEKSPRKVDMAYAKKIAEAVKGEIKLVGVFQNQSVDFIEKTANALNLYAVQLHGCESPEFAVSLSKKIGAKIWKAVWLESEADLQSAISYPADALVADSAKNALGGGSGKPSNWELASRLAKQKKLVLAGGISAENALEAAEKVEPFALDANSALETQPGKKSILKIRQFMEKIKTKKGRYGIYGGMYVAETLMPALFELERVFEESRRDPEFMG
ncbi:MAG: hypothetical protein J6P03_09035, partial [Opitutales bacterium]|nr:hypothetical protein [Opitutales bacterium]